MSLVDFDPVENKVKQFFFEWIPENKRNKRNLCWHLQRLCGWEARVVTDGHKSYEALSHFRPDLATNQEVVIHKVGFKNDNGFTSNAVEGTHGTLFRAGRSQFNSKIGRGELEHEEATKNFLVLKMNMKFEGMDPMQQMFNILRYYYGSLQQTVMEKMALQELQLEAGMAPDWDSEHELFESIDLHQEPWQFKEGPQLPLITKAHTTKPPQFRRLWAERNAPDSDVAIDLTQDTTPPATPPPAAPPKKRRSQMAASDGEISFHADHAAHVTAGGLQQTQMAAFLTKPGEAPVLRCQMPVDVPVFFKTPRNKEAKEESSQAGEARAAVIDLDPPSTPPSTPAPPSPSACGYASRTPGGTWRAQTPGGSWAEHSPLASPLSRVLF